jgi:hypothetical protein
MCVDEPALRGVDAAARPVVEHRRLAFLVHVHLEKLLHFQVAPARRWQSELRISETWHTSVVQCKYRNTIYL